MDFGPARDSTSQPGATLPEVPWLEPVPDAHVLCHRGDPAELAASRETIRLAFVAALQHLPPRQRAVLILREVLRWKATEVAELLGTSVASVNSALQRARATLDAGRRQRRRFGAAARRCGSARCSSATSTRSSATTSTALTSLLHEDATQSMPPYKLWLRGRDDILDVVVRHGHRLQGLAPHPH